MARHGEIALVFLLALGALAGCSKFQRAERPAWRTRAEAACFAQRRVTLSNYIQPASHEIDGPSICGLTRPLKVTALLGGTVLFNATQTLDCPMVAELDAWLYEVVQPAAVARFGAPVAQLDSMGAYNCRGMNNQMGARLSEHSFGNAIDIGGFELADGRRIILARDWTRGDLQTRAFLHDVHNGACGHFATVLSPGSNLFHYNHIHVDLAQHGMTSTGPRRICKPAPQMTEPPSRKDSLPDAPDIDDDLDIAQVGVPNGPAYVSRSGPDLALAAATIEAAPARRIDPYPPPAPRIDPSAPQAPPLPPRRTAASGQAASGALAAGPLALHAPAVLETPPPPPARGRMRDDGVFVPEGRPADFDLPTSRFQR
ncbi:extensin family protein [uncultured Rhodoblastus sp.]|uniref:extensin-like domain-containing protein n=1 Tax=uncultured Rhodoblastus sp. TaxID=543037 RepID=UPI0025DB91C7|nr:extensin family protein [uncultured Rhodoblastus sp.]